MEHLLELSQHVNQHLIDIVLQYQHWAYITLFLIFFAQTGIIPAAFLPGDSLLLALGTFAAGAVSVFNVHILFLILFLGTFIGKNFNYFVGILLSSKLSHTQRTWMFNLKYIQKAQKLYEKWGGYILIAGCFLPVLRTFSPCIAGICQMRFLPFLAYNVIGSVLWVGSLLYVGFWVGNIPIIQEYFSLAILGFILLSLFLPLFIKILRKVFSKD